MTKSRKPSGHRRGASLLAPHKTPETTGAGITLAQLVATGKIRPCDIPSGEYPEGTPLWRRGISLVLPCGKFATHPFNIFRKEWLRIDIQTGETAPDIAPSGVQAHLFVFLDHSALIAFTSRMEDGDSLLVIQHQILRIPRTLPKNLEIRTDLKRKRRIAMRSGGNLEFDPAATPPTHIGLGDRIRLVSPFSISANGEVQGGFGQSTASMIPPEPGSFLPDILSLLHSEFISTARRYFDLPVISKAGRDEPGPNWPIYLPWRSYTDQEELMLRERIRSALYVLRQQHPDLRGVGISCHYVSLPRRGLGDADTGRLGFRKNSYPFAPHPDMDEALHDLVFQGNWTPELFRGDLLALTSRKGPGGHSLEVRIDRDSEASAHDMFKHRKNLSTPFPDRE